MRVITLFITAELKAKLWSSIEMLAVQITYYIYCITFKFAKHGVSCRWRSEIATYIGVCVSFFLKWAPHKAMSVAASSVLALINTAEKLLAFLQLQQNTKHMFREKYLDRKFCFILMQLNYNYDKDDIRVLWTCKKIEIQESDHKNKRNTQIQQKCPWTKRTYLCPLRITNNSTRTTINSLLFIISLQMTPLDFLPHFLSLLSHESSHILNALHYLI